MIDKIKRKKNMFKTFLFSSLLLLPTTGVFSAADGDGSGTLGSIVGWIYDMLSGIITWAIKFVQSLVLCFCSFGLRFINKATNANTGGKNNINANLYTEITHAFRPFYWFSKTYLIPLAIIILTLGLVWGIMKSLMSGSAGSKDDPIKLIGRTLGAGIVVFISPYIIVALLGGSIATTDNAKIQQQASGGHAGVVSTQDTVGLVPTLLESVSQFDLTKGEAGSTDTKFGLNLNNITGEMDASDYRTKNENLLASGAKSIFNADETSVKNAIKADSYEEKSADEVASSVENLGDDKSLLSQISSNMYSAYVDNDIGSDVIWKILYLIIFAIMPGMIVYNLVMILYIYVKRLVALILSTCIAPIAIAFFPGASTNEVTGKWIKSVIGYSLMTTLTLAFAKLGTFVYVFLLNIEYGDTANLLIVIFLQLACIAILGQIREMESFVNNLGGNLVGMKPAITGTISKIVSGWGEKGVMLGSKFALSTGKSALTSGITGGIRNGTGRLSNAIGTPELANKAIAKEQRLAADGGILGRGRMKKKNTDALNDSIHGQLKNGESVPMQAVGSAENPSLNKLMTDGEINNAYKIPNPKLDKNGKDITDYQGQLDGWMSSTGAGGRLLERSPNQSGYMATDKNGNGNYYIPAGIKGATYNGVKFKPGTNGETEGSISIGGREFKPTTATIARANDPSFISHTPGTIVQPANAEMLGSTGDYIKTGSSTFTHSVDGDKVNYRYVTSQSKLDRIARNSAKENNENGIRAIQVGGDIRYVELTGHAPRKESL